MAATTLSFTETSGGGTWEATFQVPAETTVNVDIERAGNADLFVFQKATSATNYKDCHAFEKDAKADQNFNIANNATDATIEVKIVSKSEVTNCVYE